MDIFRAISDVSNANKDNIITEKDMAPVKKNK